MHDRYILEIVVCRHIVRGDHNHTEVRMRTYKILKLRAEIYIGNEQVGILEGVHIFF